MACDALRRTGTAKAVPALAPLLSDEKLNDYARDALEEIPDPSAGKALVDALGEVDGSLRVGIIITLGDRGEAAAVAPLAEIAMGDDATAAGAALTSLALIGGEDAAGAILAAAGKAGGEVKAAAGHAALLASEREARAGNGDLADKLRAAAVGAGVSA